MAKTEADFPVSCAFVGLHLISRSRNPEFDTKEAVLLGCAQILGLFIERAWKERKDLEETLADMKRQRTEDAKANDKVVGIFASHEQSWLADRRRLKDQIRILVNELRSIKADREEFEEKTRSELEEKVRLADEKAEEMKVELTELFEKNERFLKEIKNLEKDNEHKDRILSAMLRKSRMDTSEKEAMQREMKIVKAKRKQAEMEADRWRSKWESRKGNSELRSSSSSKTYGYNNRTLLLEHLGHEWQKEHDSMGEDEEEDVLTTLTCFESSSSANRMQDLVTTDIEHLQNWVQLEIEKQTSLLEQRHNKEAEAFIDQISLKDEKLAAAHWRILSTELETKRLNSHVEALHNDLTQSRADNSNLLEEVNSLKEQVKSSQRKPRERKERTLHDIVTITSIDPVSATAACQRFRITEEKPETREEEEEEKSITLVTIHPTRETEQEKEVNVDSVQHAKSPVRAARIEKPLVRKDSSGKMDIQALGVAYKIKRLKQQLVVLERLAGMDEGIKSRNACDGDKNALAGVMSLLHKQVQRFQSLEEKTDDLCTRMSTNSRSPDNRDSRSGKSEDQRKILHNFLEETFQLQRYMVATGQKLMDIQLKISRGFGSVHGLEQSAGFSIEQFADVIRTLFREIQRGLELKIARMIGDIEGTLARNGILHM